ncbi:MAG: B12-binding domain-containing radical SAM protein, partial [Desulfatitalea sp.]|nr:B12-binding domain-containing radical SAM protein [Desulfatitalea sp.]NNJ99863.1 B12-binding domain-containing radical SAM protein [Desulfatitalea sp.]
MKVLLISMPDVAAVIMHEAAFHMPSLGIATLGANLDPRHEVYLVDLIRKRSKVRSYLHRTLRKLRPDVVGLSAMTWQFGTCLKLARLIKRWLPSVDIVVGGYHATLMYEEIGHDPGAASIDFLVRGEGEEAFRRLVNALDGTDDVAGIPSVSYRGSNGDLVHNERGELLDLSRLKLPIRDKRRLTWGYHIMNRSVEVIETSRGCTRTCNFCSIRHMYGQSFRPFPIERILADIDDIYYKHRCRWIFVADDNMVLSPKRVIELCRAVIARRYRGLNFVVQADCVTMSRNEEMVRMMAKAGFKTVFLGIENASAKNLQTAHKGDIVSASRSAVEMCHKYGIMVVGGMIFGFPDDTEEDIKANYRFLKSIAADTAYCQILTPYPKTGIRRQLLDQGLVTNPEHFATYNGIWANVRTRHLGADQLQYLVWYYRQTIMGWWEPSRQVRAQGSLWIGIWIYFFKPLLKVTLGRRLKKIGWKGRYALDMARLKQVNRFTELD